MLRAVVKQLGMVKNVLLILQRYFCLGRGLSVVLNVHLILIIVDIETLIKIPFIFRVRLKTLGVKKDRYFFNMSCSNFVSSY